MSIEETTGPVRMPDGVRDYLARGTTPAGLAEAECAAAVAEDGGRSYDSAVAYLSREKPPVQPREGKGIMTLVAGALEMNDRSDREEATPEAGA